MIEQTTTPEKFLKERYFLFHRNANSNEILLGLNKIFFSLVQLQSWHTQKILQFGPVFHLAQFVLSSPIPVRKKRPQVAGSSVLNFKPSIKSKKFFSGLVLWYLRKTAPPRNKKKNNYVPPSTFSGPISAQSLAPLIFASFFNATVNNFIQCVWGTKVYNQAIHSEGKKPFHSYNWEYQPDQKHIQRFFFAGTIKDLPIFSPYELSPTPARYIVMNCIETENLNKARNLKCGRQLRLRVILNFTQSTIAVWTKTEKQGIDWLLQHSCAANRNFRDLNITNTANDLFHASNHFSNIKIILTIFRDDILL